MRYPSLRLRRAHPIAGTVALVDKDQLEILQTLRLSVSEEKTALVEELTRVKADLQAAEDKAAMYLTQVRRSVPALCYPRLTLRHTMTGERSASREDFTVA